MQRIMDLIRFFTVFLVCSCSYFNNEGSLLEVEWSESKGLKGLECEPISIAPYIKIDTIVQGGQAVSLEGRGNECHVYSYNTETDLARLTKGQSYIPYFKSESLVAVYSDSIVTYLHENEKTRILLQRKEKEVIARNEIKGDYELIQSQFGLSYLLEAEGRKILIPNENFTFTQIELEKEATLFPTITRSEEGFEIIYTSNEDNPALYWLSTKGDKELSFNLEKPAKEIHWIKGKGQSHLFVLQGNPFDGDSMWKHIGFDGKTFQARAAFPIGDAESSEPYVLSKAPLHFLMLHRLHKESILKSYRAPIEGADLIVNKVGVLQNPEFHAVPLPLVSDSFLVEYQEGFATQYLRCQI